MDSFNAQAKPFLPLESAILSTLRGAMKSDSLCAYFMLLISDIGHQYHMFEMFGLDLLLVLCQSGKWEGLMSVMFLVLPTFSFYTELLHDKWFKSIVHNVFTKSSASVDNIMKHFNNHSCMMTSLNTSKDQISVITRLWHHISKSSIYDIL